MTTETHEFDGCPPCIVRTLTEGSPRVWAPGEPASVTGVVLGVAEVDNQYPGLYGPYKIPCIDLWTGGMDRVRIVAYGATMLRELTEADPKVGDTLTVEYLGYGQIGSGKYAGKPYRRYHVSVKRGHH